MKFVFEEKGFKELQKKLKKNKEMADIKHVVQKHGNLLNARMKAETKVAFQKGYSLGDTAGSINTKITGGGLTVVVAPETKYSPYLEYGTRFMEAEPFVKPAFNEQKEKFKADMQKLVR